LESFKKEKSIKIKDKIIHPDDVSTIKKGKKVAFIMDTALTESCYELAEDADVLISEATLSLARWRKLVSLSI
jgi:ribonuclease BN (tRNA processing enzyme)